jgi:Hemerythrin HHE cation binding domain
MAQVHNVILRGLNAIDLQCTGLSPGTHSTSDILDFLFYCHTWAKYLTTHHDVEEELFFPAIEALAEKPGIMDSDRDQHAQICCGLEKFTTYVDKMTESPGEYDGHVLKAIIAELGGPLETHLHDEIDHLLNIGAKYDPNGRKIKKVWDELGAIFRRNSDKVSKKGSVYVKVTSRTVLTWHRLQSVDLPFILGSTDRSYEGGIQQWPPIPFFVPYLTKYLLARGPHYGSWRFGGSDLFGHPKALEFLPQV